MDQDAQADRIARLEDDLRNLQEDNARLRRLLDTCNAPDELRHRQRNMLAMLRGIIRRSSRTEQDLDTYAARLEDRLDAVARVQHGIDLSAEVDLHTLLADELLTYAAREGEQVTLAGPGVHLQPKAARTLALALHELAVNAIEHGVLTTPAGRLSAAWSLAPGEAGEPVLLFTWKETGPGTPAEPERCGFGTEVLTNMLRYDLNAATTLAFEPDGLRCTIRLPLPAQVGRIEDERGA